MRMRVLTAPLSFIVSEGCAARRGGEGVQGPERHDQVDGGLLAPAHGRVAQHEVGDEGEDEVGGGVDGGLDVAGEGAAAAAGAVAVGAGVVEVGHGRALEDGAEEYEHAVTRRHEQRAPDDVALDGANDDAQQVAADCDLDHGGGDAVEGAAYEPVLHRVRGGV